MCELAFDHEPGETCSACGLPVDKYGNTEADFRNCSFPNCGCDGHRLCMAPSGANENAYGCNVEGMYMNRDAKSLAARFALMMLCNKKEADQ